MRFYGYTRAQVLAEPVSSFFALLRMIPKLEAQADRRALLIAGAGAHPGERGEAFQQLYESLTVQAGEAAPEMTPRVLPGVTPGVVAVEAGVLQAEHAAQMARADEIRRQWLERLGRPTE